MRDNYINVNNPLKNKSMSILRPFQKELYANTIEALGAAQQELPAHSMAVVMSVLPTGGGKTKTMTEMMDDLDAPQAAIAHRQELVSQISLDLARREIKHSIVGSESTQRMIRMAHLDEIGRNFVEPRSEIRVCGIDTLNKLPDSDAWLSRVRRFHGDEGHHFLAANKWGKGVAKMRNAQGVLWTATPCRADGKGLGRKSDGLADRLVMGPGMRQMIDMGYLTDYRLIGPEVDDLDLSELERGSTGDFIFEQARAAIKKSKKLVGNVVDMYKQFADNKLAIVFAIDIEEAVKITDAFKAKGIRAEVVTGKTPDTLRRQILRQFANREIQVLVNVDLFGEGFDVPAVELVIMARPTWSFPLYAQQFGRSLRLLLEPFLLPFWAGYEDHERRAWIAASEKPAAIVIDLVGNWVRNHLPDWIGHSATWDLERRVGGSNLPSDTIPLRSCANPQCMRPYEAHLKICPHCKTPFVPASRATIKQVEGDVFELSPQALATLRNALDDNLKAPAVAPNAGYQIKAGAHNRFVEKVKEIQTLRTSMATWCAWANIRYGGQLSDAEQAKAFYFTFGIDVMTAQSLNRAAAESLRVKVQNALLIDNVVTKAV